MTEFLVQLLNGLVYGVFLLNAATGLSLLFGLRGVINFAHGALYVVGAYVGYEVGQTAGFWVALFAAPLALAVFGWLFDIAFLRRLSSRPPMTIVLFTFGFAYVLTDLVHIVWGADQRSVELPTALTGRVSVLGAAFPVYRLFVIVVGLTVAVLLLVLLSRTQFGLHVRAASRNPMMASMVGVDAGAVGGVVVAIAFGLVALAGVLAAPVVTLTPGIGATILIESFIVMVLGGLASVRGTIAAALLVGMVTVTSAAYIPVVAALAPYVLVVGVLLARPVGLAGSEA